MSDDSAMMATPYTVEVIRQRCLSQGGTEVEHFLLREIEKQARRFADFIAAHEKAALLNARASSNAEPGERETVWRCMECQTDKEKRDGCEQPIGDGTCVTCGKVTGYACYAASPLAAKEVPARETAAIDAIAVDARKVEAGEKPAYDALYDAFCLGVKIGRRATPEPRDLAAELAEAVKAVDRAVDKEYKARMAASQNYATIKRLAVELDAVTTAKGAVERDLGMALTLLSGESHGYFSKAQWDALDALFARHPVEPATKEGT